MLWILALFSCACPILASSRALSIGDQTVVDKTLSLKNPIYELHVPFASFIKVHFDIFDIPHDAVVQLSDKNRKEMYEYRRVDDCTVIEIQLGVHSTSLDICLAERGFMALSVSLDTVIIEVISTKEFNVVIDYVLDDNVSSKQRRLDEIGNSTELSTCGANERLDVECFAQQNPVEYERTRPVARLLIEGRSLCTAWRVGATNRMFTNNHCISTQASTANTEVWFNFQRTGCGAAAALDTPIKVRGATMLTTGAALDYTVFTVDNFDRIASFGYFGLDVRNPGVGERIYIPQHGAGNPKELAISSDANTNGICQVDSVASQSDLRYMCDTIGGSSGSPVLSGTTNKVIALHHLGGCPNSGARIAQIWPQVATLFNNQIPNGDVTTATSAPVATTSAPAATPATSAPVSADCVDVGGFSSTVTGKAVPCSALTSYCLTWNAVYTRCKQSCGVCQAANACEDNVPSGLMYSNASPAPCAAISRYCYLTYVQKACPATCDTCESIPVITESDSVEVNDEILGQFETTPMLESSNGSSAALVVAAFAGVLVAVGAVMFHKRRKETAITAPVL